MPNGHDPQYILTPDGRYVPRAQPPPGYRVTYDGRYIPINGEPEEDDRPGLFGRMWGAVKQAPLTAANAFERGMEKYVNPVVAPHVTEAINYWRDVFRNQAFNAAYPEGRRYSAGEEGRAYGQQVTPEQRAQIREEFERDAPAPVRPEQTQAVMDYLATAPDSWEQVAEIAKWQADPNARPEDMPEGGFLAEMALGVTPVGLLQDIRDVYRDITQKNVGAWTMAAALPIFGDFWRGGRRALRAINETEAATRGARMVNGRPVITIEHRGPRVNELGEIDPAYQFTGQPGAEAHPKTGRAVTFPESYEQRSFWNVAGTHIEPRFEGQPVARIDVDLESIYDGVGDPNNFKKGLERMTPSERTNLIEQRARQAGYKGIQYRGGNTNEVHLFEAVPTHTPEVDIFDLEPAYRMGGAEGKGAVHTGSNHHLAREAAKEAGEVVPANRGGIHEGFYHRASDTWFTRDQVGEMFGALTSEDISRLRGSIEESITRGRRQGLSDDQIVAALQEAEVPESTARRFLAERDARAAQVGVEQGIPQEIPTATTKTTNVPEPLEAGGMDAIGEAAMRGDHVIANLEGDGFVGAPEWVKTRDDLVQMRRQMDEYAQRGISGRHWYARQRAGIAEVAGPDPVAQEILAAQHGITSSQATPAQETLFQTKLQNRLAAGADPREPRVRAGYQVKGFEQLQELGEVPGRGLPTHERIPRVQEISGLGEKTAVYGMVASNPLEDPLSLAPHDVWDRRAMGYGAPDQMTKNQRRFSDYEQVLGARRMGMTPQEYQASIWTTVKAEGLQAKSKTPMSWEEALREAEKSASEALPAVTGHEPYELVPAAGSRQLPGLLEDPALAAEFSRTSPWVDPETGRDVMYEAAGIGQRPTLEAPGAYRNPAGELEQNPAFAGRPVVAPTSAGGIDPASEGIMQASTAVRGYTGVQAGSPYALPIRGPRKPKFERPGLVIDLAGKDLTPAQVERLNDIFERRGMYFSPAGDRAVAGPFDPSAPTLSGEQLAAELEPMDMVNMRHEIEEVLGRDVKLQQAATPGGYTAYEFGEEGSGQATRQFLENVEQSQQTAPRTAERIVDDPRVRDAIEMLERRTEEFGPRAGGYRQDVQNARRLLRTEGIAGLRRALEEGKIALPALVAMFGARWVRDNLESEERGLFGR